MQLLFIMSSLCLMFVLSCTSDAKTLTITPSKINFMEVYIGNTYDIEVTLRNKLRKDILITDLDIDGSNDFAITSGSNLPIYLLNNTAHKLTITFEPTTDGKIEATLSIEHDGSDNAKVVSLIGVGEPCARIVFSEQSCDFSQKSINKAHTHDFDITNSGTADLILNGLIFTGTGAAVFKVTPAPITVVPGAKTTITITFETGTLGKYAAELLIGHNAVNENTPFAFPVTGEGRNADPKIALNQPSPWDFGKVTINKSSVPVCEIENTGIDPLTVSSATLQSGVEFTIDSLKDSNGNVITLPTDISVGDKILLAIKFAPNAKNTFNDVLTLEHNGTNEVSPWNIPVIGKGVVPGLDFNGDGYCDVLVGADHDDDGGTDSGCAFIFYGSATPPGTIDASAANVKFVGENTDDQLGCNVSSAGDFNGDGYDDVIIGASLDDDGGTNSGCAFIFFGSATPLATIDASAANVKLIGGDTDDRFGVRVSNAGDFNKDGFDDVIVGAHLDDDGGTDSGCAFIFFGSATPSSPIDASAANVKLIGGDAGDRFGVNVSIAGDFNNDGFDDVIVGADCDDDGGADSGCAFIFFGSATPSATIDASATNVKLVGGDAGDKFGYMVSEKAGDFNNDGFDDVIVGAHADDDGGLDSGCAFIFFGSTTPSATIDASAANVKLIGEDSDDRFGIRVSSAGDFNNDGFDDLIIGAFYDDDGGSSSGCSFIFFGSTTPSATIDASNANVKLVGADSNDRFGHFVSSAGDFNDDGFNDVIVGAYLDDDGGTDSGCAFMFFGSTTPSAKIDASSANVKLVGGNSGDRFGVSVGG